MEIIIAVDEIPYVCEQLIADKLGLVEPNGICNKTWIPIEEW
jgi:hypothetical protein